MVIKRSKFPKKSLEGTCRRGQVVTVRENEFQISFDSKEFLTIKKEDSNYYEKPHMKGGVLCIYYDNKKDFISRVYSLDGKLIFEKGL
jgi:hypothetical protein